MYDVLVPLDKDDGRSQAQVESVLKLPNADDSVHALLLHVFDDRDRAEETSVKQITTGNSAYGQLTDQGIKTTTMTAWGDPTEEILRVAEEEDVDMIVLGGRKRNPIGSLLFGSVSQSVSLKADRPVAITGEIQEREREEEEEEPQHA